MHRDLEKWIEEAVRARARAEEAERLSAEEAERREVEMTADWERTRLAREDYARTVFHWLLELQRSGVLDELATVDDELSVWGPIDASGVMLRGGSGSRWVSLVFVPEPALRVCRRVMACAAKTTDIRSLDDAVEHIPTGVLARMAADIASGDVWELVREALVRRRARFEELTDVLT